MFGFTVFCMVYYTLIAWLAVKQWESLKPVKIIVSVIYENSTSRQPISTSLRPILQPIDLPQFGKIWEPSSSIPSIKKA